jgi:MraZ protein
MAEINQKLNPYNRKHQDLLDELMSDMAVLEVDTAGRVLLPKRLTEEMGISKEVDFVGRISEIRLWDKAARAADRKPKEEVAALAEELLGGASPQT